MVFLFSTRLFFSSAPSSWNSPRVLALSYICILCLYPRGLYDIQVACASYILQVLRYYEYQVYLYLYVTQPSLYRIPRLCQAATTAISTPSELSIFILCYSHVNDFLDIRLSIFTRDCCKRHNFATISFVSILEVVFYWNLDHRDNLYFMRVHAVNDSIVRWINYFDTV